MVGAEALCATATTSRGGASNRAELNSIGHAMASSGSLRERALVETRRHSQALSGTRNSTLGRSGRGLSWVVVLRWSWWVGCMEGETRWWEIQEKGGRNGPSAVAERGTEGHCSVQKLPRQICCPNGPNGPQAMISFHAVTPLISPEMRQDAPKQHPQRLRGPTVRPDPSAPYALPPLGHYR